MSERTGKSIRAPLGGLDPGVVDIVIKLAYFASPAVVDVVRRGDALEIALARDATEETTKAVERDVEALIARLREGHRPLPGKRVFDRRASREPLGRGAEALTRALVHAGWARRTSPGAYAFGPRLAALVEALDQHVRRLAQSSLSAEERSYPPIIAADVLCRAGTFASFPQNVGFVSHLPHGLDAIERFKRANGEGRPYTPPAEAAPIAECLPLAVCHHRFQELSLERSRKGSAITARGACFRYEGRHHMRDLSRLWCFQMREIVYVGDAAMVSDAARRASEALFTLAHDLDLTASCETASDPFFADVLAEKRYAQLAHDRKVELRLPLGGDETIAAASINAHEDVLTRAFGIHGAEGEALVSGCAAFGLERLALGFLAQHGLDEARWPRAIAAITQEHAHGD